MIIPPSSPPGIWCTSANTKDASIVHFFAAGALEAQGNLLEAQTEMEVLLKEDPKSGSAPQFRTILEQIKQEQTRPPEAKLELLQTTVTMNASPSADDAARYAQTVMQQLKQRQQIAEAEAEPEATCAQCGSLVASNYGPGPGRFASDLGVPVLRVAADEVGIFFAVTNHGKPVTNLTTSDITIRDDNRPPEKIRSFRNEAQLPLRLGLIIDTSESVTDRFAFEQAAAAKFLQTVVTGKDDLAFVVGVNNSVLLVQDLTADQTLTARAVGELAPGGATALWDAVAFAAGKLTQRREEQPVARVLVVLSDGKDNSSSISLKQAIAACLRGEVMVYTVSTRDLVDESESALIGDQALATLSELTGGTTFVPGSVRKLAGSLADIQQVIRSRYLISYKPAGFHRDGRYRPIELTAQRDGHEFKVYARKGYYAAKVESIDH